MPMRPRGLRALHARLLDGPHGRSQVNPWPVIAAVVAGLLLLLSQCPFGGLALPATGQGSACDGDGECPPALCCGRGKCGGCR